MNSQICVDASLMVSLLVPERFSQAALSLWQEWVLKNCQTVAPLLLRYEVTSALYRKTLQDSVLVEDAHKALEQFLALDIEWVDPPHLPVRAIELAELFKRPNTYDAHYLALAEYLDCPFWTGDKRLYNATKDGFSHIQWVGNHPEASSP